MYKIKGIAIKDKYLLLIMKSINKNTDEISIKQ